MKFLRDNGLSLAFFGLFALCFVGQVLTAYRLQFEDPAGSSPAASRWAVLLDPGFLKAVFSNWQAALLQLLVLVVLTVFLRQKGASHSRKPEPDDGAARGPGAPRLGWFGRPHGWAYANSLSLGLALLFCVTFAAFVASEWGAYGASRGRSGEAALSFGQFIVSADLWFNTFQTWQAEFFAMGAFLLLTIFLRQDGSAESKAVDARDEDTGNPNE